MSNEKFYTPEEVKPLYGEIIPAYQSAFADEPWYEVSKCADIKKRCAGGLSAVAVGSMCSICELSPARPAYETDELTEKFDQLSLTRPTMWYGESADDKLAMAAVAWKATPSVVAADRYSDVPEMEAWLAGEFDDSPIVWVDEVFANKNVRSKGNLQNFGKFVIGLNNRLGGVDTIAYRTISPQMVRAAERDFGSKATVLRRQRDVPDRRDFIIINTKEDK